jgi:putative membrane protein
MLLRLLVATLHLVALGIGLGAVWARARGLRRSLDPDGLRRVFVADAWWGVAAALWISTGLFRLLMGLDKTPSYYLQNHLFWGKMLFLVVILGLEILPMATLIRWRRQLGTGAPIDTSAAGRLARISVVQAALVVAMIAAATGMARGYGARG